MIDDRLYDVCKYGLTLFTIKIKSMSLNLNH